MRKLLRCLLFVGLIIGLSAWNYPNGWQNPGACQSLGVCGGSSANNVGVNSYSPGATVDVQGTVRALYFSGNGSQLTGISGSGTVTSVATGAGLTGGPITTTGTISATYNINAQTGTTYTIQTTDASNLVTFSNSSPVAVTLPVATTAGFGAGFSFDTQNLGSGTVTITPTTSTINGTTTLTEAQNTGCTIVSDGTNYQVGACTALGASSQFSGTNPGPLYYASGNLGLGSSNPGQQLDVVGTSRFIGLTSGIATLLVPKGNVGIGSANPGSLLDVDGTVRFIGSGNLGVGSSAPGELLDVDGTIRIATLGNTLAIASGTNGCLGTGTLTSGTQTISTTCTPSSVSGIFLTDTKQNGANIGAIGISTVTAGTSFVVDSTNASDASTYNWLILKTQ